jgi:hypothetical protein
MQNPIIQIINADLAYSINMYTNIKRKLLTCNSNIYLHDGSVVEQYFLLIFSKFT